MYQELLSNAEFYVITFPSTQTALQAERTLERASQRFLLIPMPSEISAECGLAVKCLPEDKDAITQILTEKRVEYSSIHYIVRKV